MTTTEDIMLTELEDIAARRRRLVDELDERRDELVRSLLRTSAPRERIAESAGVSVARLYQIRDGRR